MSKITGLMLPYLRGKSLKTWVTFLLINTVFYIISTPFYFIDKLVFLYLEMLISITSGVFYPMLSITWDLHTVKKYDKDIYERFKYVEQFRSSLGGIAGYFMTIMLQTAFDTDGVMKIFFVLLVFVFLYEVLNYKVNYYGKSFD
jgi:nitrate/nitrite transporter NarK